MIEAQCERQAYIEVLQHETTKIVRMVRAFPAHTFDRRHPDCGMSAHELTAGFVRHARRIEAIANGDQTVPPFAEARTRGGLLLEFELACTHVRESLERMPAFRWAAVMDAPAGLAPWRQGRRGELLWLALREMSRHSRHFARHLGEIGQGGAALRVLPPHSVLAAND